MQEKETKLVTICGSTRFKKEIMDVAKELTLEGYIVMLPFVFGHSDDVISDEDKKKLDRLHLEKIDMSSEVHVVLVGGYSGKSTRNEIDYASSKGKRIIYHSFLKKPKEKPEMVEVDGWPFFKEKPKSKAPNPNDVKTPKRPYVRDSGITETIGHWKDPIDVQRARVPKSTRPYVPDTKNCVIKTDEVYTDDSPTKFTDKDIVRIIILFTFVISIVITISLIVRLS